MDKPTPAQEKYCTFKGIYLTKTQTYYLCDFYEVQNFSAFTHYRVELELPSKLKDQILIQQDAQGELYTAPNTFPPELNHALIHALQEWTRKKAAL